MKVSQFYVHNTMKHRNSGYISHACALGKEGFIALSSGRLVAVLLPRDGAHSKKCTEAKWRTIKTASYTEIDRNTSHVGLSQVCTDHSNIDRHRRRPELSRDSL